MSKKPQTVMSLDGLGSARSRGKSLGDYAPRDLREDAVQQSEWAEKALRKALSLRGKPGQCQDFVQAAADAVEHATRANAFGSAAGWRMSSDLMRHTMRTRATATALLRASCATKCKIR